MKLTDLISQFRRVTGDRATPYLWDDESVVAFLNAAVEEAAVRCDLIFADGTDGLSNPVVAAGEDHADMNGHIYRVITAHFVSGNAERRELAIRSHGELSLYHRLSHLQTAGDPTVLVLEDTKVFLLPPPLYGGVLELAGYRTPAQEEELALSNMEGEPVIAGRHHSRLHHWAVYLALSDVDLDSYAPRVAASHLEKFENYFGDRLRADRQRLNSHNLPHRNRLW